MNFSEAPACNRCGHGAQEHLQGQHLGACTHDGAEPIGGTWTATEVCSCGQYV